MLEDRDSEDGLGGGVGRKMDEGHRRMTPDPDKGDVCEKNPRLQPALPVIRATALVSSGKVENTYFYLFLLFMLKKYIFGKVRRSAVYQPNSAIRENNITLLSKSRNTKQQPSRAHWQATQLLSMSPLPAM
jgi:hypothetical protein